MAAKAFLEQYMECMDALPLDLQRLVSQYWELDSRTKHLVTEARSIQTESEKVMSSSVANGDKHQWLLRLQRVMLALREVGNEKLEITSQMLDTAEGYSQQLMLTEKEVDSCRTRDELTGTRASSTISHSHKNSSSSIPAVLEFNEKKKTERNQKRSRTHEKKEEEIPPAAIRENKKEGGSTSVANITTSSSSLSTPMKPQKKKVKVKKRSSGIKEQSLPVVVSGVPTPDFTTEPIDPDEPTYCLCNQVSFGEMIGCDNDECLIEWFHFQCVGLTSKPKGKWYCPQCQPERSKHKSGKT